jgi:glycosyltransferase involved in cell wall biosynthesis
LSSKTEILVITHTAGEDTPAHHLVRYLARRKAGVALLELPFYHSRLAQGDLTQWQQGIEISRQPWAFHPGNILLQLIKDPGRILSAVRALGRIRTVVALDNMNAAVAIVLRYFGWVDKVVYYVIDHTPRRFENYFLNWLYARMDVFCCMHADKVWVLCQRMHDAKQERGAGIEQLIQVPIGVRVPWRKPPIVSGRKPRMVVVSHLEKSKGVQLIIESMPDIIEKVPAAELHIYGSGPYEQDLIALMKSLGLQKKVFFHGFIKEHSQLLAALPQYQIGLAPYLPDAANYSHWADPAKPKEYLASGLPVVITRVPWISHEIENRPMGIAIDYKKEELVDACVRLFKDHRLRTRCRNEGLRFTKHLDWDSIFSAALASSSVLIAEKTT